MDREKVIREIEDALSDNLAKAGYIYGLSLVGLKNKALTDALELLKKQDKIIQNILQEKANELNDKLTTLQIEAQNREIRRLSEQK